MARPKKPRDEKFCYEVKTYVRISTGVALEEYARIKRFDGISQAARELLELIVLYLIYNQQLMAHNIDYVNKSKLTSHPLIFISDI